MNSNTKLKQYLLDGTIAKYLFFAMFIIRLTHTFWTNVTYYMTGDGLYAHFDLYGFLYYCVDYSNGIVTRGLGGAIIRPLFNNCSDFVLAFAIAKWVMMAVIYLIIIGVLFYLIKKSNNNIAILIGLISIRPFYLLSRGYAIRTDHFWYVCLIFMIILLLKDSKFNLRMVGVTLLSTICMLFHHAFIFIFAPLICLILFEKKQTKWFIAYGIIMCIEFLLLTFFGSGDYDYIVSHMVDVMSNLNCMDSTMWDCYGDSVFYKNRLIEALEMEYNDSRATQIFTYGDLMYKYIHKTIPLCLVQIFSSCMSFYLSLKVIHQQVKKARFNKLFYVILFLPFVVLCCFTIDIDRWYLMLLTTMNIFAIYLLNKYKGDYEYMRLSGHIYIFFLANYLSQFIFLM